MGFRNRILFIAFLGLAVFGESFVKVLIHAVFVGVVIDQDPAKGQKSALCSFTFDDGPEDQYQAVKLLNNKYHFPGTCYIITRYLSKKDSGKMGPEQILDLDRYGNEIGSHTFSHKDLMFSFGDTMEIRRSERDLEALLGKKVKSFSYPYGRGNILVEREVKKIYENARIVGGAFNTPETGNWHICTQSVKCTTTINDVNKWIKETVKNKYWLVLLFHNITPQGDEWSCSPEMFEKICSLIQQSGIRVLNVSDAINIYQ